VSAGRRGRRPRRSRSPAGRSVAAHTSRSRSTFGPVRVPWRRTSVTTYRAQPSASSRARTSNSSRPSCVQPWAEQRGAADVEPDRDPIAVPGDRGSHPLGPFQRGGADVDSGAAGREGGGERVVVRGSRRTSRPRCRVGARPQRQAVRAATERGVEVDEVHTLRPVGLPGQRGVERRAVPRLRPGLTLH